MIKYVVPELVFPIFPAPPAEVSYDDATETVTMPLEYYTQIYNYKVQVDSVEHVYNVTKELWEGKGGEQ